MLLAVGRSQPLKNLRLTLAAWRRLPAAAAGAVPVRDRSRAGARAGHPLCHAPSDSRGQRALEPSDRFVQTSRHEGFCLPILEAMAAGCAVVCTDAHGNRDFCANGANCLMPDARAAEAVAADSAGCLPTQRFAPASVEAGIATAAAYDWGQRIDALERFMFEIAGLTAARN